MRRVRRRTNHREVKGLRFPRFCMPRRQLLSYLAIVIALFIAVASIDIAVRERANQTAQVERITCEQVNRVTQKLIVIINRSTGPTPIPPGADDALRTVIEQSNLARQAYREQALADLTITNCLRLVKNPPPTTTTTVGVSSI